MSLSVISDKHKNRLNGSMPAARDGLLGTRIQNLENAVNTNEVFGVLTHNYAGAHADKSYVAADLPTPQIVYVSLSNADAAANLILPVTKKFYIVYNNTGYTITVKVSGQSGVQVGTGQTSYMFSDGTDIESATGIASASRLLSKSYSSGHADITLSAEEMENQIIVASAADAAVNMIAANSLGKVFYVINNTGYTLTFKVTGQTGILIANADTCAVICNGTDYVNASGREDIMLLVTALDTSGGDVTLTAAQMQADILEITTGHAANAIIAPTTLGTKMYFVINNDATNPVLIKKSGGTAVVIPKGMSAIVYFNGTNYARISESLTFNSLSVDYSGAHADYTMSEAEGAAKYISITNADAAANLIPPSTNNFYYVYNNSGYTITVKASGQTGVLIKNGKTEIVVFNGTDYVKGNSNITNAYVDGLTLGVSIGIDLSGGDVTPTTEQINTSFLEVTTGHAANAILLPTNVGTRPYIIVNNDATLPVNVKKSGGTAVVIPAGKVGLVYYGASSEYVEILNNYQQQTGITAALDTSGGDVTLTAAQAKARVLEITTGHAANAIIAPTINDLRYTVVNNDTTNPVLIKKAAGTAVYIPAGSVVDVYYNGTNYIEISNNFQKQTGILAAVDLSGGDVTLTSIQLRSKIIEITTGHASNAIIAPSTNGQTYVVVNNDATNPALIKKSGGTAIIIPKSSTKIVYYNGTDYVETSSNMEIQTGKVAAIDLSGGDITLTAAEALAKVLEITTGHAANAIIAPTDKMYIYHVINNDASNAVLIKKSGGTPITIPAGTNAIVYYNGSEYEMIACNEVTLTGTQTLTNKTLTNPKFNEAVNMTLTSTQINTLYRNPGAKASTVLRVASNVADQETVTIGADIYEVVVVNTDSTQNTAGGELNNTTDPVTFTCTGHARNVGDLVRVENEIMEVTAIPTADTITVSRGHSNTSVAAHADGLDIFFAANHIGASRIGVGLVTVLTPAVFTDAFISEVNNDSHVTEAVTAVDISANEVLIVADAVGNVALVCAEGLVGANNEIVTPMAGGNAAGLKRIARSSRVPDAIEIALDQMHFNFDFTPTFVDIQIITTATGVKKYWDGGWSISGGQVTINNGGAVDWAATDTVYVTAYE